MQHVDRMMRRIFCGYGSGNKPSQMGILRNWLPGRPFANTVQNYAAIQVRSNNELDRFRSGRIIIGEAEVAYVSSLVNTALGVDCN